MVRRSDAMRPQPPQLGGSQCKRVAATALLLLTGGALVNVAVALVCMVLSPVDYEHRSIRDEPTSAEQDWWSRAAPPHSPQRSATRSLTGRAFGLHVAEITGNRRFKRFTTQDSDGVPVVEIQTLYDSVVHLRIGWPLRSFSAERWLYGTGPNDTRPSYGQAPGQRIEGDVEIGGVSFDRGEFFGSPELRIIAYRPMLLGFTFNTFVYAAILGIIMWCAIEMRRMNRRRRGLCGQCAYPAGVSGVCTECGAAVTPASR